MSCILSGSATGTLKKIATNSRNMTTQKIGKQIKSRQLNKCRNQAGRSNASKLTCAHLLEPPFRVLSNASDLDSQPSASTSKPGVFRLGALQLLTHADLCAEIVFVVVDGHNGSWRVESMKRGTGFRRPECCASPASFVFNFAET